MRSIDAMKVYVISLPLLDRMRRSKELADKHRLALVLVHHLRKASDDDPMNMVSGSTGLIGAVDGIYILTKDTRADNQAKLHITGRDTPDMQLRLELDREDNVWQFVRFASGEVQPIDESLLVAIEQILVDGNFTGTASELIAAVQRVDSGIEIKPNRLTRLLRDKTLELEKRGIKFATKRTNNARMLTLDKVSVPLQIGDGDDKNAPRG